MADLFSCWKCGAQLQNVILPMSRREECHQCSADQHTCKMCRHFDYKQRCNEDRAETVSDTEKANFCDYFAPSGKVFDKTGNQKALDAKAKLAALFGDEPEHGLSQESDDKQKPLTPAEIAEQKLRDLLGG